MYNKTKIAYWTITVLVSLQLVATGIGDIILAEPIVNSITHVGFPISLIPFLGIMKILGALTILFVKNLHLKISAYAGVLFYSLGAFFAHVTIGDPIVAAMPALLLISLNLVSYFLWKHLLSASKS